MILRKQLLLLTMVSVMLGFTSCSDDDDELPRIEEPTGSFTLPDQPLDEEMVFVEDLSISKDGWIVVRRDNGENEPVMTEIISMPEYIEAGTYDEVSIRLKNNPELVEGEKLWVNLHVDDGDMIFEYSASNQADEPILNASGGLVAHSFIVDLPDPTGSVLAEDQELEQNRKLTISSVVNSHPGWVVVYPDLEGNPDLNTRLSVPRYIEPGTHTDLKLDLEEDVEIENDLLLWVVLHLDDGDKVFEFTPDDELDLPVLTESDEMVMDSFKVEISVDDATGSIRVSLQSIEEDRKLLIPSVEMSSKGWLVLHGDSNWEPELTETLAEPKLLEAGSHQDIEIILNEDVELIYGKNIWAALYTDDGDNIYEFDGTGETDTAFLSQDGASVAARFSVYKASAIKYFFLFITQGGISAWPMFENDPGWLMVYRDNALGAPSMSEPVSNPIFLANAETFSHVFFKSGVNVSNEEILWLVLHSDDGDAVFEYEEDNDIDSPAEDADGNNIRVAFRTKELTFF